MSDFTIIVEAAPTITCVAETVTLVEAVPIAAPGPPGADGSAGATGATGAAGAAGSVIHRGSGIPDNDIGINGDWYIDEEALKLYGPKAAGVYPAWGLDLQGPAGAAGSTGATGATGSFSGSSSDDLPEGSTNLYYTAARAAEKENASIRAAVTTNGVYNGTNSAYTIYPGLDVAIPTTGLYLIRAKMVCKTAAISQTIQSRFETSGGLVLGGVTGDPSGLGMTNAGFLTQTLTTGSPAIINGPVRSNNALANVLYAEFVINVTTVGTLRTCMSCVTVTAGMLTVFAGSHIEAIKLS